ncbi:hypothetical protein DV735_g198, partial [Chaetothyriales sp. CBS 134920]
MPAIPSAWMAPSAWHHDSLHWAGYVYQHLLAPQVKVQGRIAIIVLCAVVWAFGWLLWRAYSVIQTPNDTLVEKLGLDIPPAPKLTLEEISPSGVQIGWKPREPSASILEYEIEVNGQEAGKTKKTETACVVSGLVPGGLYDIRVFCVSGGRFKTPSTTLHVRLPHCSAASSSDANADTVPTVRAISARQSVVATPPLAPAMAREHSGGQPSSNRRATVNRKPSPVGLDIQLQHLEQPAKTTDDELDGNLVELSQRFQDVQQQIEAVETQIQDEEREYEGQLKDLESRRDKLKQHLKKRDEESSDLRRQVHKAETQNRALLNDKSKKERELQLKENERKKKRDEVAKWEEQIATMAEEITGIETQKAAIQRRAQSEIGEIKDKIEEEQKEVAILEQENREKAVQIQALEQERKELNFEDDTDETREAERLQSERTLFWRQRFSDLQSTYTQVWYDLQQINSSITMARQRLVLYENARRHAAAQFVPGPLDLDAARRGIIRPLRRTRPPSSHASSSISSPRPPYALEHFQAAHHFTPASNVSPTAFGAAPFNPVNGMTYPSDIPLSTAEETDTLLSVPMSPHAEVLLPADLLGDESADELADDSEPMPTMPTNLSGGDAALGPFAQIGSPTLPEDSRPVYSPSAGSSSGRSFSSPVEAFASVAESDQRSSHSHSQSVEVSGQAEDKPSNSKRLVQNLFSFNTRARGKTSTDQGPALGSLKVAESQSFPRNFGDADQPRRRQTYGSNWAFPSHFLQRGDKDASRLSPARKALPGLIPTLTRSSDASANYDPFTTRANSLDPGFGGRGSDSPRPASIYSFDMMPRPSVESQLRAWSIEKSGLRNSPLVPDWGSFHSFSLNHSRRPSVQFGSTSNLSLPVAQEQIIESRQETKPLQAPIGTRPASAHRPVTPKLNPAAPSFTMLFKSKSKDRSKLKEREGETISPSESRKSKDAPSLAATTSTTESRESLHRSISQTSNPAASETAVVKPTLMSRISRKASSNKFGSWKDKGSLFSRKEVSTSAGEHGEEEMHYSVEHLGRSIESASTTFSADDRDKKGNRASLGTWNFMRVPSASQ